MAGIRILNNNINIQNQINNAIIKKIDRSLKFSDRKIRNDLELLLKNRIENSEVWQSIAGNGQNSLDAHFGIKSGATNSRIRSTILDNWLEQINIEKLPTKNLSDRFVIGFRIEAIESNWQKILDLDESKTINNRKGKDELIYWMEWLLTGNTNLPSDISEFGITFDLTSRNKSRSGKAVMKKGLPSYEFPENLVGGEPSTDDNFITRILDDIVKDRQGNLIRSLIKLVKNAL